MACRVLFACILSTLLPLASGVSNATRWNVGSGFISSGIRVAERGNEGGRRLERCRGVDVNVSSLSSSSSSLSSLSLSSSSSSSSSLEFGAPEDSLNVAAAREEKEETGTAQDGETVQGDSILIPYLTEYPVNDADIRNELPQDRLDLARRRVMDLGYFQQVPREKEAEILASSLRGRGRSLEELNIEENTFEFLRRNAEAGKLWSYLKTENVPSPAVTRGQVSSVPISFASPCREDVETMRKNMIIGRARIHWFPRYFGKTLGELYDYIKHADVILDVRDARLPLVSDDDYMLNVYNNLFTHKPKILVFTHADEASTVATEDWGHYYRIKEFNKCKEFNKNIKDPHQQRPCTPVVFVNARDGGKGIITLVKLIVKMCARIRAKRERRGLEQRPCRAIVLGLPNVGKSALINRLLNRYRTASYNAAGVTRDIRWVRLHPEEYTEPIYKTIDVIDTPGVLPPNLYSCTIGKIPAKSRRNKLLSQIYFDLKKTDIPGGHSKCGIDALEHKVERNIWLLCAANQIVEGVYNPDEAAEMFLEQYLEVYRYNPRYVNAKVLLKRVGLEHNPEVLEADGPKFAEACLNTASQRHHGGDYTAAAKRIMHDFAKGRLGPLTLQIPPRLPRHRMPEWQARQEQEEKGKEVDAAAAVAATAAASATVASTGGVSRHFSELVEYSRGIYEGW